MEAYEIGPFECRYCGSTVKLRVVAEDYSQVHSYPDPQETPFGRMDFSGEAGWAHRLLLCPVCKKVTFERVYVRDGEYEETEVLFPPSNVVPDGLPERVAREFGAALKERMRHPNAYAGLLGRTLDAICTDRCIPSRDSAGKLFLGARLSMLAKKENLKSVAGAVGLRNVAAHADLGQLQREDLPYLETLVTYILEHLYVIPAVNQKAVEVERVRKNETKRPPEERLRPN